MSTSTRKVTDAPDPAQSPELQRLAQILAEMGQAVSATLAEAETTKGRLDRLEALTGGLLEAMGQLHAVLGDLARVRRL